MDSAPTIVGHRLAKSYGTGAARIDVLRELSVEIFPGELTLCTGPSGSGKSTLLAALSGLLTPDAGHASLLGQDLGTLDERGYAKKLAISYSSRQCGPDSHAQFARGEGVDGALRAELRERAAHSE